MDRLKAIHYFVASAEGGSFARAARLLGVSVPAVQKAVSALETHIGAPLLTRNARGVQATPAGSEYLDRCRSLLSDLDELSVLERRLQGSAERLSGTLMVAAHPQLAHHVLLPVLPRLHELHPELEIDFRCVHRIDDPDAAQAEVLLLHGWPDIPTDRVHRRLGGTHTLIVAAPEYWAAHGVPAHPLELRHHTCLSLRNPAGILLDLWEFSRGAESVQVPVRGWLNSNSREAVRELVLAGQGVARFTQIATRHDVQAGRLVPVLHDWRVQGGPPLNLVYRASARRNPRTRAFIDFVLQRVRELCVADDAAPLSASERPAWHRRGYSRASAALRPAR